MLSESVLELKLHMLLYFSAVLGVAPVSGTGGVSKEGFTGC